MIDTTSTQWFNQMSDDAQSSILQSFIDFKTRLNELDEDGFTLLMRRVIQNDIDCVRALLFPILQTSLEIDMRNMSGQTALHLAVDYGRHEMVELLLDAEADASILDQNGLTAAGIAAYNGDEKMLSIFSAHEILLNEEPIEVDTDLGIFEAITAAINNWSIQINELKEQTISNIDETSDDYDPYSDKEDEDPFPEEHVPVEDLVVLDTLIEDESNVEDEKSDTNDALQDILYRILGRASVFTSCN